MSGQGGDGSTQKERRPTADVPRTRVLLDRALSASAGLVAVCALAVSGYQAYIMRQQLKMSAWPYVTQGNTGHARDYARLVQNVGIGPALVRSMQIVVDGRAVRTWGAVGRAVLRTDSAGFAAQMAGSEVITSSVRPGMVLLAGSTTELLRIRGPAAAKIRTILNDDRLHIRVCYCSLYGECWLSDSGASEPAGVAACPSTPSTEFES